MKGRVIMKYKIGLDIGIASVGWACMQLNENDEPMKIIGMGSRVFDTAEQPKTGASLALPRREARSARRRLRRHRHRLERIKLLIDKSIMPLEEIEKIYSEPSVLSDIYEIRYNAIEKRLDKEDFVRLLIHLAQRRGFKSNRKVDAQDKGSSDGKLLTAVNKNRDLMNEKGYRTIGEMLYKDEKFSQCKRNKSEDYGNTFLRSMLIDEIHIIFAKQREFGNEYASEAFEQQYIDIYSSQRQFDEGPGGNSKYGGNQVEKMLGNCTFEKGEKRAFKAQYSSEYCSLLQKINSIKTVKNGEKTPLSEDQRKAAVEYCKTHATATYSGLRKALAIGEDTLFNISYGSKDTAEVEKKTKLNYLDCYHKTKKAFGDSFKYLSKEQLNAIGYALSAYKNDEKIADYLDRHGFDKTQIELVLTIPSYSKTGKLSVKACDKLIPYLEQGMLYHDACTAAGYDFKNDRDEKSKYLPTHENDAPELGDITNPVVRRSISQTIKVINSIIRQYGQSPCFISVELARELSKDFYERNDIKKNQEKNRALNERIKERIENEYHHPNPTGLDIVKFKLWEEQDGTCPYSLQKMEIERLFEPGYVDVDHIVPYSISFDDSYNNKVLVFTRENRQKGNRLPLQYVADKDRFRVWVNNNYTNPKKRANLLKESISEEDLEGFKVRNLTDTKYISRFIYNFIRNHLEFAPNSTGKKKLVTAVNGACTAYLRSRWGIQKIRANGDVHHAVDAVVIACITDGMIQKVSKYSDRHETRYCEDENGNKIYVDPETGEVLAAANKDLFPLPYREFRDELEIRTMNDPQLYLDKHPLANYGPDEKISPIFVSRMAKRKNTGPAHMETVKSGKYVSEGILLKKVELTKLKLDKDGEIDGYFNPESDLLLYNALKARLAAFDGDGAKAFAEPFYKPKHDGTKGPVVKKVKVYEKTSLNVSVQDHKGVADNGSMIRVDVFVRDGKYYLVPIYVSDTVKDKLPNKAIVAHKPYDEWVEMNDDEFVFSLYPRDLIKVTSNKDMSFSLVNKDSTLPEKMTCRECFVYYVGTDIATASISVIDHDNTYKIRGLGVKTLPLIEKYQVDVLGNITKVQKEKRQGFTK